MKPSVTILLIGLAFTMAAAAAVHGHFVDIRTFA